MGGIRFTAIRIGEQNDALLLGPLVVDPAEKGKGFGRALVEGAPPREGGRLRPGACLSATCPITGVSASAPVRPGQIALPGPVDPRQLLRHELVPMRS